jgi:hypothetical protein
MEESFERKLKQVVRKRLGEGEDPGTVLAELKSRLDPARAEAILADAKQGLATANPRRPGSSGDRILLLGALGWAVALLLQNVSVIAAAREGMGEGEVWAYPPSELAIYVWFAMLKIGLLLAAAGGVLFARTNLRFLVFALALLYAFPLGRLIEGMLMGRPLGQGAAALLYVSALFSYASAAVLIVLWRRSRDPGGPPAESHF